MLRSLFWMFAGLFGYRPDYSVPLLDWDGDDQSGVGPNGMILVIAGQTVTVDGGLDRLPTLVEQGPAGPNPFAQMKLPEGVRERNGNIPVPPSVPPHGQTRFSLWVEEGGPTFLCVENGNDVPVVYITYLVEFDGDGLKVDPTVTCAVRAKGGGVESRHQPIKAAYIGGMRAVPDDELCYDAATGRMRKVKRR